MLLDTLLELAGGINNVTRILAPQGQVVLALKHPRLSLTFLTM